MVLTCACPKDLGWGVAVGLWLFPEKFWALEAAALFRARAAAPWTHIKADVVRVASTLALCPDFLGMAHVLCDVAPWTRSKAVVVSAA